MCSLLPEAIRCIDSDMSPQKRKAPKPKSYASGPSIPNGQRHRPLISITFRREMVIELDRQRGDLSRGVYLESLLEERR